MKKNKGFSLIEIIIVIAIMAILIAIVAVNVIRYIEKAHVAADLRLLDGISAAVTFALMDPDVLNDPTSASTLQMLEQATASSQGVTLSQLASPEGNRVAAEIMKTMGWETLNSSDYMQYIQTQHTAASDIYVQHKGGAMTPYAVWVTYTDSSGGRDVSDGSTRYDSVNGVGKCVCAQ